MKKKIVLIGGGGHCKSVLDSLLRCEIYDEIVITDFEIPAGTEIMGCKVAGNDDVLPALMQSGFTDAFITVGCVTSAKLRIKLFQKIAALGFRLVNIVDPTAVVSAYSSLGSGIFIGKNAVVNAEAKIGDAAIINTGAIIEHECSVGAFTHISVGAKLCGNVAVGAECLVGAGATVIQGVTVADRAIIGAGSTVIRDVPSDVTRVGLVK